MNSMLKLGQSESPATKLPKLSADIALDPVDLDRVPSKRAFLGTRAWRALARFLITLCIGVAATLAWQSYGDATRQMIARSSPQLVWLAPQPTPPVSQSVPDTIAPAVPSPDTEQLKAMSLGLATMRQSVDQLAAQLVAGQEQLKREVVKLQAGEREILQKISVAPLQAAAAPARKPVPSPSQAIPMR